MKTFLIVEHDTEYGPENTLQHVKFYRVKAENRLMAGIAWNTARGGTDNDVWVIDADLAVWDSNLIAESVEEL